METLFWDKHKIGMYLLKRDHLYRCIRENEKGKIIEYAWRIGEEAADEMKKEYTFYLPSQIAVKKDISLTESVVEQGWNYSEYLPRKNEIILYKKKILDSNLPEEEKFKQYQSYSKRRELFIAHELFHYLEYNNPRVKGFRKQYQITVLDLKFCSLKRQLVSMSEIGAYGFTKKFFEIDS